MIDTGFYSDERVGLTVRAPTGSKALHDLNLPPTPKEGVHTLSFPDVG